MFTAPGDAAGIGLALSQLNVRNTACDSAPLLWVQDRKSIREMGRMFLHGLPAAAGRDIVHVAAQDGREALWAMAEGLKCPSLGAVIGEIHGDPRALDFTATRRLAVAAERYGVPAFLLRVSGNPDLSGARRRWRAASRPSLPHPHDENAPGMPVWSLDLFRARDMPPHIWEASYDQAALRAENRLDMVSPAGTGPVEEDQRRFG
ncbi:recA-like protein [Altererythrobacter aquiaggeris]|uniref:recA-like protein n=1 Tax=Aestuarierythrobacter aquiaggeris TaxID=1898396 RepID=UPI003016C3DC